MENAGLPTAQNLLFMEMSVSDVMRDTSSLGIGCVSQENVFRLSGPSASGASLDSSCKRGCASQETAK